MPVSDKIDLYDSYRNWVITRNKLREIEGLPKLNFGQGSDPAAVAAALEERLAIIDAARSYAITALGYAKAKA